MNRKKIVIIAVTICIVLTIFAIWRFSFVFSNAFIHFSGFVSQDKKSYYSPQLPATLRDSLQTLVTKAEQRNASFWGIPDYKYRLVLCATENEVNRYAGNNQYHTVSRHTFLGTFVVLDKTGFDLDIISHELCHAYFWSQIGLFDKQKIPVWFDEGIALQLDFRPFLRDTVMEKNYTTDFNQLKKMETYDQFYNPDSRKMRRNYIIARIELKQFFNSCGMDGLHHIMQELNKGGDFMTLYKKTKENCHGTTRLLGEGN